MEASITILFLVSLRIASGQGCQQFLTAESGWFSGPDDDHTDNSCWFYIEADQNLAINLTSIDVNISCSDSLWIFDGSIPVVRACHYMLEKYISQSRHIRVYYEFDNQLDRGGFNISYEIVEDPYCGHEMWRSGSFGSDETDLNYYFGTGLLCWWRLQEIEQYSATQFYVSEFNSSPCRGGTYLTLTGTADRKVFYCDSDYSDTVFTFHGSSFDINLRATNEPTVLVFFTATDLNQACGGIRINSTGTITSVDSDGDGHYDLNVYCVWTIIAPEIQVIEFEFDYIDIEYSTDCQYDEIKMYDGTKDDDSVIQKFCGSMSAKEISSVLGTNRVKTNILTLAFYSDEIVNAVGFRFTYRHANDFQEPCRIRLLEDSGAFGYSQDEFNIAYGSIKCTWIIEVFTDHVITIQFHNIETPGHTNCDANMLQVYDGFLQVGRNCSEDTVGHEQYTSEARSMRVKLMTDGYSKAFFNASYFLHGDLYCGYSTSAKTGRFGSSDTDIYRYASSLNNSSDYAFSPSFSCSWTIQKHTFGSSTIQVYIAQLDFHRQTSAINCTQNRVEVFDDNTADTQAVCEPGSLISVTTGLRFVHVRLIRESEDTSVTFQAFYAETDDQQLCGGILTNNNVEIGSIDADKNGYYDNNLDCVWTILAPKGYVVDIEFVHVDLEDDKDCHFDYIEIFNGTFHEDASVLRVCGHWPSPEYIWFILKTPKVMNDVLIVQFVSDATITRKGFNIAFEHLNATALVSACGGLLTDDTGSLGSPDNNNDGLYDSNVECVWTFETNTDKAIQLKFIEIRIDCNYDSVTIYDGYSLVGQYCGTTIPEVIVSKSRRVRIKFVSGRTANKGGFEMTYELQDDSRCGYLTSNLAGRFGSSDTDINTYMNPSISCQWTIEVFPDYEGLQIYVTKLEFSGQNDACTTNNLQIFKDTDLFGSYCEAADARVITTTSNTVEVSLKAATEVTFEAFYVSINDSQACGGILTSSSGEIQSVDRDQDGVYENNLNCVWLIIAPENHVIDFDFQFIDIEDDENCRKDSIQLYDSHFHESAKVLKICGHWTSPGEIWSATNNSKSQTNILIVQFLTNDQTGKLGFKMTYEWRSVLQVQENRAAWKMTPTINIIFSLLISGFTSVML